MASTDSKQYNMHKVNTRSGTEIGSLNAKRVSQQKNYIVITYTGWPKKFGTIDDHDSSSQLIILPAQHKH